MITKFIDAEKLKSEIEFWLNVYSSQNRIVCGGIEDAIRQDGRAAMCEDILTEIHSLQQDLPEVDFDDNIENYIKENFGEPWDGCVPVGFFELSQMARHFINLGLNARKEE